MKFARSAFAALIASVGFANAERWYLRKFRFPGAKTLEVVHFFTMYGEESPIVRFNGNVQTNMGIDGTGTQMTVIHSRDFAKIDSTHFCCSDADVKSGLCKNQNQLIITQPGADGKPKGDMDARSWLLKPKAGDPTTVDIEGEANFNVKTSGLYFVTVSNCDNTATENVRFIDGEIETKSNYGFLPGEEVAKLSFYGYLSLGYVGLGMLWFMLCFRWWAVLFTIHKFISICIMVGFFEVFAWYVSLYHWNYEGHRWHSMIALATLATTVKQGVSYMLLLGGSLGWGVTKPNLESKTLMQVTGVTIAFIICDAYRQYSLHTQDRTSSIADNPVLMLLIIAPGSFFVSLIYVWIFQALNGTIKELTDGNQTMKAELYQNLRLALCAVTTCVIVLVTYETVVVRRADLTYNWQSRWFFTDLGSHSIFFGLLAVMMFLWRPNERSEDYAYSVQLDCKAETGLDDGTDRGLEQSIGLDVELGQMDDAEFNHVVNDKKRGGVLE